MVLIAVSLALAASKPDLSCHSDPTGLLYVNIRQWSGIRHALFKLDRKTLSTLVSANHGIVVRMHSGKSVYIETVPKRRFMAIGKDSEYGPNSPAVQTDPGGDSLLFKWFWVDLAHIEMKAKRGGDYKPTFDRHVEPATWAIFGWTEPKKGEPSTRVQFGSEDGHLVIKTLDITMEPAI